MVRPRTFDQNVVLDRAIDLFSRQGFEATTVQHLETGTGLGRGSLYAAFGDKLGLFRAALDRYDDTRNGAAIAAMDGEASGLTALRRFFADVVDETVHCAGQRECLITIATIEMAARDEPVSARVIASVAATEAALARAIARAQHAGEIASRRDPAVLARSLMNTFQGIKVRARVSPDRATLSEIADMALESLG